MLCCNELSRAPHHKKDMYKYCAIVKYSHDVMLFPEFSIWLPCSGNSSGIGTFEIGLVIQTGKVLLKGTPLRLSLKKECAQRGVYLAKAGIVSPTHF